MQLRDKLIFNDWVIKQLRSQLIEDLINVLRLMHYETGVWYRFVPPKLKELSIDEYDYHKYIFITTDGIRLNSTIYTKRGKFDLCKKIKRKRIQTVKRFYEFDSEIILRYPSNWRFVIDKTQYHQLIIPFSVSYLRYDYIWLKLDLNYDN